MAPELGELPADYFSGGAHVPTGELAELLNKAASAGAVRPHHVPVVTPSSYKSVAGKEPSAVEVGTGLLLAFTVGVDVAYRQYKVPPNYAASAALHIHWTKTADAAENGKVVRWRVTYVAYASSSTTAGDLLASSTVAEVEDTYDDDGTTSRLVYRTPDIVMVGVTAGYYVALKVEAVAPSGAPLAAEPGLLSVDFTFEEYANR